MSDVLFKIGNNGPYASCNVILCNYWTGRPPRIGLHLNKVHGRSIESCGNIVEEFVDFYLENGGDHSKISIFKPNNEIRNIWKNYEFDVIENILELLNEHEMEELDG